MTASFAGDGISARDHWASTEKKPVTFAAICRASSRLRSRPRRGAPPCRLLRAMVSPKTSRAVPRRSVLLVSGLEIPPMMLDDWPRRNGWRRRRWFGSTGHLAQLLHLERFDVLEAVGDAATELQELRALSEPALPLQRLGRNAPALSQLLLIKVLDAHVRSLLLRRTHERNSTPVRWGKSGGPRGD